MKSNVKCFIRVLFGLSIISAHSVEGMDFSNRVFTFENQLPQIDFEKFARDRNISGNAAMRQLGFQQFENAIQQGRQALVRALNNKGRTLMPTFYDFAQNVLHHNSNEINVSNVLLSEILFELTYLRTKYPIATNLSPNIFAAGGSLQFVILHTIGGSVHLSDKVLNDLREEIRALQHNGVIFDDQPQERVNEIQDMRQNNEAYDQQHAEQIQNRINPQNQEHRAQNMNAQRQEGRRPRNRHRNRRR